jgi:hypothetical protein
MGHSMRMAAETGKAPFGGRMAEPASSRQVRMGRLRRPKEGSWVAVDEEEVEGECIPGEPCNAVVGRLPQQKELGWRCCSRCMEWEFERKIVGSEAARQVSGTGMP